MARLLPPTRQAPKSKAESSVSKMQAFLIVIMCICFALMVYINLTSTSQTMMDMHHYRAALNLAMEEFKVGGGTPKSAAMQKEATRQEDSSFIDRIVPDDPQTPTIKSKIASLSDVIVVCPCRSVRACRYLIILISRYMLARPWHITLWQLCVWGEQETGNGIIRAFWHTAGGSVVIRVFTRCHFFPPGDICCH